MSPENQRLAIAAACGIEYFGHCWSCITDKEEPMGVKDGRDFFLPDYLNDLDAMHAAENVLNPCRLGKDCDYPPESEKWGEYVRKLLWVCEQQNSSPTHATAAQRAEAFLRTLNFWDDSK